MGCFPVAKHVKNLAFNMQPIPRTDLQDPLLLMEGSMEATLKFKLEAKN